MEGNSNKNSDDREDLTRDYGPKTLRRKPDLHDYAQAFAAQDKGR